MKIYGAAAVFSRFLCGDTTEQNASMETIKHQIMVLGGGGLLGGLNRALFGGGGLGRAALC